MPKSFQRGRPAIEDTPMWIAERFTVQDFINKQNACVSVRRHFYILFSNMDSIHNGIEQELRLIIGFLGFFL